MVHDSMVRDSNKLPMTSSKVTVHCHGAKAMMMNDNTVVSFMYQLLSTLHLIKEKRFVRLACTLSVYQSTIYPSSMMSMVHKYIPNKCPEGSSFRFELCKLPVCDRYYQCMAMMHCDH